MHSNGGTGMAWSTSPPTGTTTIAHLKSLYTPHAMLNATSRGVDYSNVDFTQLGWLEVKWAQWYLSFSDVNIATGLMLFLLHETAFFGRCIPWIIVDAIPYFRRWKIQPNKVPSAGQQWECMKLVLISHFTLELPQIWLFHPLAESFGMATWQIPFPPWTQMCSQIALFFVFEDLYTYCVHRTMHYGPLYRNIHKWHHKYSAPFGLVAEYSHPIEVIVLAFGTFAGPLLCCYFNTRSLHVLTVYIWVTLRLFQAIDAHSGYDFPWSLHHFLPFWAGAEHHDFHHVAFSSNYSTSFRYLDFILGTDKKYREHKAKLRVLKAMAARKGASCQEQDTIERQLLETVEKTGLLAEAAAESLQPWGS